MTHTYTYVTAEYIADSEQEAWQAFAHDPAVWRGPAEEGAEHLSPYMLVGWSWHPREDGGGTLRVKLR